jgi:hypothetical protein
MDADGKEIVAFFNEAASSLSISALIVGIAEAGATREFVPLELPSASVKLLRS